MSMGRIWLKMVSRAVTQWFPWGGIEQAMPLEQWLLDRLPEAYRLAVWLHCCEGMTCSEVADTLSITEPSVQGRVREGLKYFQNNLTSLGVVTPVTSVVSVLAGADDGVAPYRLLKNLGEVARMS